MNTSSLFEYNEADPRRVLQAISALFDPVQRALDQIPSALKSEPEYILLGLIPRKVLALTRKSFLKTYDLYLYHRLLAGAILDPEGIAARVREGEGTLSRDPGFYSAAHLNAFPQHWGLPLYVHYLARFPELQPQDYYDLIAHWFPARKMVEQLVDLFARALRNEVPCDPETILKPLCSEAYRHYVDWDEIEHLYLLHEYNQVPSQKTQEGKIFLLRGR